VLFGDDVDVVNIEGVLDGHGLNGGSIGATFDNLGVLDLNDGPLLDGLDSDVEDGLAAWKLVGGFLLGKDLSLEGSIDGEDGELRLLLNDGEDGVDGLLNGGPVCGLLHGHDSNIDGVHGVDSEGGGLLDGGSGDVENGLLLDSMSRDLDGSDFNDGLVDNLGVRDVKDGPLLDRLDSDVDDRLAAWELVGGFLLGKDLSMEGRVNGENGELGLFNGKDAVAGSG